MLGAGRACVSVNLLMGIDSRLWHYAVLDPRYKRAEFIISLLRPSRFRAVSFQYLFFYQNHISLYGSVMAQITTTQSDPNGNQDSGYAPSNIEDILAANVTPPASPHQATIYVNRNVHYKTKNGSTSAPTTKVVMQTASPKKEPFR